MSEQAKGLTTAVQEENASLLPNLRQLGQAEGLRTNLFLGDGDQVWGRPRCEETDEIISRDGKDRFNAEEASQQTKKQKNKKTKKRKKQKRYFRNGDETKATASKGQQDQ